MLSFVFQCTNSVIRFISYRIVSHRVVQQSGRASDVFIARLAVIVGCAASSLHTSSGRVVVVAFHKFDASRPRRCDILLGFKWKRFTSNRSEFERNSFHPPKQKKSQSDFLARRPTDLFHKCNSAISLDSPIVTVYKCNGNRSKKFKPEIFRYSSILMGNIFA